MAKPFGIYIHIPFCQIRCDFCPFDTHPFDASLILPYIGALKKEITHYKNHPTLGERSASSIYFGGGTPSLLSSDLLSQLIAHIDHTYGIEAHCEITLEAHPSSMDRKKIQEWKCAGITRLSLGLQSFSDHDLSALKRNHNASWFVQRFQEAREVRFHNINCDLIFGLPGQSLSNWLGTLEATLQLHPDHLSLYGLTIEEGTVLHNKVTRGITTVPSEAVQLQMYTSACQRLAQEGFQQYEISSFSKKGKESHHNLKYWKRGDYLGLGCSAHASLGAERYWNINRPQAYIQSMNRNRNAQIQKEILNPEEQYMEGLVFGLRQTKGVSLLGLEDRFDFTTPSKLLYQLDRLNTIGLLRALPYTDTGALDQIQLSQKGIHLADEVALQLMAYAHD